MLNTSDSSIIIYFVEVRGHFKIYTEQLHKCLWLTRNLKDTYSKFKF